MDYPVLVESNGPDFSLGIYCPRCGTQSSQADTKFCRACGADLTLVSQAMGGQLSWRTHLLSRIDNFFLSRQEYEERESARQGGWNIFLGTTLLGISFASLITSAGGTALWIVLLLFSLVSLKIGIGNLRLYRRYLRGDSPPQIRPNKEDLTLLGINKTESPATRVPAQTKPNLRSGVTETTTALLGKEDSGSE
jgi:hypothetical protein